MANTSQEDNDETQNQSASVPVVDSTVNDAKYVFYHISDVRSSKFYFFFGHTQNVKVEIKIL